ncbi:LOW QUALITY PROTEIN: hypothetical protein M8C21_027935, partial [Ambrosia artemisiifolia]
MWIVSYLVTEGCDIKKDEECQARPKTYSDAALLIMKLQHKYPVQVGYMAASFAQDIVEKSWNYKILKVLFTSVAMSRFSTYEIGGTLHNCLRSFIRVQEYA